MPKTSAKSLYENVYPNNSLALQTTGGAAAALRMGFFPKPVGNPIGPEYILQIPTFDSYAPGVHFLLE